MIADEFTFYSTHQKEIVEGHLEEFVVIKDQKVLGYYEAEEDAFDSMLSEKLGTFMVKKCQLPGTDVINYYNNAVVFV
jgi:hypothetical protein